MNDIWLAGEQRQDTHARISYVRVCVCVCDYAVSGSGADGV